MIIQILLVRLLGVTIYRSETHKLIRYRDMDLYLPR